MMIKLRQPHSILMKAVLFMIEELGQGKRDLHLPSDGRYQPVRLKALLGYDNWACWLVLVEWFWLRTLAVLGEMPPATARLLTTERLLELLKKITTTKQDAREYGRDGRKGTNHDINALLELMRRYLPEELHPWLHFGATSYDIINTAYALQIQFTYRLAFWPLLCELDELFRQRIGENVPTLMMGRTHLQHALPITAGFWLANFHARFVDSANQALVLCQKVPGKFTGAVGTSASQRALIKSRRGQQTLMKMLGLPTTSVTTQITPPEAMARYYMELVLLSGGVANFGDDVRKLVAPEYGEVELVGAAASTSSTMSHKVSNPIGAEAAAGMHVSVIAENMKVVLTLISDFQRDLRWSNVMRSQSAVMVYCFQQLLSAVKVLKNFRINGDACQVNFDLTGKLVMSELLHLSLQKAGLREAHRFANSVIVPSARESKRNLADEMDVFCADNPRRIAVRRAWVLVPNKVKELLRNPEAYLGDAIIISQRETRNKLMPSAA